MTVNKKGKLLENNAISKANKTKLKPIEKKEYTDFIRKAWKEMRSFETEGSLTARAKRSISPKAEIRSQFLKAKAKEELDKINSMKQWLPTKSIERTLNTERECIIYLIFILGCKDISKRLQKNQFEYDKLAMQVATRRETGRQTARSLTTKAMKENEIKMKKNTQWKETMGKLAKIKQKRKHINMM